MPLKGMILKDGATGMTPVGGTDMTFTLDGTAVANGIHTSNAANADFLTRENFTFKYRPPKQNADGSWAKAKFSIIYAEPSVDANGYQVYDIGRFDLELLPTSAASVGFNICMMMAQALSDADTLAFRTSGALD